MGVVNGCNGYYACARSNIGGVINACNQEYECYEATSRPPSCTATGITCTHEKIAKKWKFACKNLKKKNKCRAEVLCEWNGEKCDHLFKKLCKKADAGKCSKVRMMGESVCHMG